MQKNQLNHNEFLHHSQLSLSFDLLNYELCPEDPVFTLLNMMEELNYNKLFQMYSRKGTKGYDPVMMFSVLIYASMRGIRSVDDIVEACTRDLGFIFLTKGQKPKRDAFYDFRNKRLKDGVLEHLHYQIVDFLNIKGMLPLQSLYIDGTKLEANANRYTFVWRGSINYHLMNLLTSIEVLMKNYNEIMRDDGYDKKYHVPKEKMFFIEGDDEVRRIIKENRKRKRNKQDKLPNNKLLKIDNIDIHTMYRMIAVVGSIIEKEGIKEYTNTRGKRHKLWRIYNDILRYTKRLMAYKESFEIMGDTRNSYSKTDFDATFMRMKSDHMRNGQLKAAYNVQFGSENHFITDVYVSNDRTDYNTLIPVVTKHIMNTRGSLKNVIADSGYHSENNLVFLKEHGLSTYIKTQNHETRKKRKFKNDIGKHYNMKRLSNINDETYYLCANNQKLKLEETKTSTKKSTGLKQTKHVYRCESCEGCSFKKECFYNYSPERDGLRNKSISINHRFYDLSEESYANIQSKEGEIHRMIRSIISEGAFGNMKQNHGFDRFNTRSKEKVEIEVLVYVVGHNIMKYHRMKNNELKDIYPKIEEKVMINMTA
jgi:transposase